ncbi:MAG: NAD(P)-dependent oxidoreductase [Rhodoferax sp.]|nr:NAD(P)-dependent oxidoreductase [Rhodoferax sp.]
MNVGYVGLGNMGGALARRLQLAHPLRVYDLDQHAVARMVEAGATACASLGEVARACDIIFLCLPKSEHVRAAVFDPDGLAGALRPGALLVDQTTGDPKVTRQLAHLLAARGVALIDAPVSGGAAGAKAGTISIMLGAGEAERARIAPLLTAISPNVFHAGDVGAGQVMKLVNNMISGAQRLLSMEGLALAAKSGVDPSRALEILVAGGARNAYLDKQAPSILRGQLEVGFTLGLMAKDMRLACEFGADSGVPQFFASVAHEVYKLCISQIGADAQVTAAAQVIDRLAGSHVVGSIHR